MPKGKMTLKGRIESRKIRSLCIKQNWYTKGSNSEYMNLLCDICDDWVKFPTEITEQAYRVAKDIFDHSDFSTEYSEIEHLENVAHYILNDATTWFMNIN